MNSREIFDCDPEKVFEKASQGDAEAQAMMGLLYQTGDGLCINEDEAEKWYSRSAEQKHPGGQYRYGLFLLHKNKAFENGLLESALCSKKRKKVIKEAVELLAEAVSCGNVQAMTALASVYEEGVLGFSKDVNRAADLYKRALKEEPDNNLAQNGLKRLGLWMPDDRSIFLESRKLYKAAGGVAKPRIRDGNNVAKSY